MKRSVQGNIDLLGTGSIGRLLWSYSLPAVVGNVVNSLYNILDRIFIGQSMGPDAIAGLAITLPVMNLSAAIGMLVGAGAAARTSIMLGAGDRRGAELVLGNTLVLTIINALVYISIFGIFIDDILTAFGASAATLPYAHDFMLYLLPGMLLMNLTFGFNNIMRASGYPIRAMQTLFIGTAFNVVLAPLFIFYFGWGIIGAAVATDISMAVSATFVMAHFFSRRVTLHFIRGIYRLRWKIVWAIIAIGASPALINITASAINVLVNHTLYRCGGDIAVAAGNILNGWTALMAMVVIGICQGMQPIIGYNYGSGRINRLKRTFWLASAGATCVVALGSVVGMTMPYYLARAFTTDAHLIDVTMRTIKLALRAFWMVGFQIVATNLFQSIGKAGISIFLSLTRQVIFLIPLLLWLPDLMGLDGVWTAYPASDVLATLTTAIMVIWQFRRFSRRAYTH